MSWALRQAFSALGMSICLPSIHKKGRPKAAFADSMAALGQRFDQKL
jgi:hypothetical protein